MELRSEEIDRDKLKELEDIFKVDPSHALYKRTRKAIYKIYNIKHNNKNLETMHFKSLEELFFLIMFIINKEDNLFINFVKKFLNYSKLEEKYDKTFVCQDKRKMIYNNINKQERKYNEIKEFLSTNDQTEINLNEIAEYKKEIMEYIESLKNITDYSLNKIGETNDIYKIFKNVIFMYLKNVNEHIKFVKKCNNPELELYNSIIKKKSICPNILHVFTNFTIPTKRNKNCKNLRTDLMLVLEIDNKIEYMAIEYDGPTHSNINDYRFNKSIILCDMHKNKYCNENNISLIRLDYRIDMNNHKIKINELIDNIILNKEPIYHGIPEQSYYNELINEYKKIPKKTPNNIFKKYFKLFINSINLEND